MSKILSNIFPLIDHLYIYQNFEYSSRDFLKWFIKNIFKRSLQQKHKIVWTTKARLLFIVSLFLILLDASFTTLYFNGGVILFLILLVIKFLYSPLFLVVSRILISPLDYYQKEKILAKTRKKLSGLSNLKVIAITGSFGKTSTKDILYTLLWKKFYVVKTPKSFNTPLGIAKTILEDVKKSTDIFICEVGAYKRGEIKNIMKLIKPSVGIITAIAPQHLERFGSLENIALAKFELPQSLQKDGVAILNKSYEQVNNLSSTLNSKVIFYGTGDSEYHATNIKVSKNGTSFQIRTPKGTADITIPLIGEHHAQNFLAASAAALQLGLTLSEIKERAKLLLPTPHRMEIKKLGKITLIDNSYNSNPKSAKASLDLLSTFEGRKIVLTPGFIELGKESAKENKEFGKEIARVADEIVIVGNNAKKDLLDGIKEINPNADSVHFVNTTQEGLIMAQQLTQGVEAVALLENDLPDQYN